MLKYLAFFHSADPRGVRCRVRSVSLLECCHYLSVRVPYKIVIHLPAVLWIRNELAQIRILPKVDPDPTV